MKQPKRSPVAVAVRDAVKFVLSEKKAGGLLPIHVYQDRYGFWATYHEPVLRRGDKMVCVVEP